MTKLLNIIAVTSLALGAFADTTVDEASPEASSEDFDCEGSATVLAFPTADVANIAEFCSLDKYSDRHDAQNIYGIILGSYINDDTSADYYNDDIDAAYADTAEVDEQDYIEQGYSDDSDDITYPGNDQYPYSCIESQSPGIIDDTNAYLLASSQEALYCGGVEQTCSSILFGEEKTTIDDFNTALETLFVNEVFGENGFYEPVYEENEDGEKVACNNWKRGCGSAIASPMVDAMFPDCHVVAESKDCVQSAISRMETRAEGGVTNTFLQEVIDTFYRCSINLYTLTPKIDENGDEIISDDGNVEYLGSEVGNKWTVGQWASMYGTTKEPVMEMDLSMFEEQSVDDYGEASGSASTFAAIGAMALAAVLL